MVYRSNFEIPVEGMRPVTSIATHIYSVDAQVSASDGIRLPSGPAKVLAPQGLPPCTSSGSWPLIIYCCQDGLNYLGT